MHLVPSVTGRARCLLLATVTIAAAAATPAAFPQPISACSLGGVSYIFVQAIKKK